MMAAIHLLWMIPAVLLLGAVAGYFGAILSAGVAQYRELKKEDEHGD